MVYHPFRLALPRPRSACAVQRRHAIPDPAHPSPVRGRCGTGRATTVGAVDTEQARPPALTPQSRGVRWLQRTAVTVMALLVLADVPDVVAGLPAGRLAPWLAGALPAIASAVAVWPLSGRWAGRPAHPMLLVEGSRRRRRAARRNLLAGRALDDRARRDVTLAVLHWSVNIVQLPVVGAIVAGQLAVRAADPDTGTGWLAALLLLTAGWLVLLAAVLAYGIPLRRAAGRAGLLPEVRHAPS